MRKKILCFDFDGVIASYNGWKGFDVLGEPNLSVIEAMGRFHDEGYFITIFTTRPFTPVMEKWLKDNKVKFDSINSNAHNPPMTSQKPIYHVIVDDRALRYKAQGTEELMAEVRGVVDGLEEI